MLEAKEYKVQVNTPVDNNIGGFVSSWNDLRTIYGWIDYLSGTDQNTLQNALTQESTHILVTDRIYAGITGKMRIVDAYGRDYQITFVDNPGNEDHHLEIYLKVSD